MLKAEFKKTWSRPLILWAFVIVCVLQMVYALMNYSEEAKVMTDAYNVVGGHMDDAWRKDILMQYEQLWEISLEEEDIYMATKEQRAILVAFHYVHFTELLDEYVETLEKSYGEIAKNAYRITLN